MATRLDERIAFNPDNLFNSNEPAADTFSVSLRAGQGKLARGTVLALSTGTGGKSDMVILGTATVTNETLTANCILCDDVDTGAVAGTAIVALAYRTGHFNRNALITKSGFTWSITEKEALRAGGILLDDALTY